MRGELKAVRSKRVRNCQGGKADDDAVAVYAEHCRDEDGKQTALLAAEAKRTATVMVQVAMHGHQQGHL